MTHPRPTDSWLLWKIACLALFCLWAGSPLTARVQAPAWLTQAASREIPEEWKEEPAVVLLDHKFIDVDEKGKTTVRRRLAISVLSRQGARRASENVVYLTDGEKVRSMNAWVIRPDGEVRRYKEKEAIDLSLADNDIYNEARMKIVVASDEALPGSVFGCEWVLEQKTVFTQFSEYLQERGMATADFSLRLGLPSGWRVEPTYFNMKAEPDSEFQGSIHQWRAGPLDPIPSEPSSPSTSALVPRIALSYFPASGASAGGPSFASWNDVSVWLTQLNDSQVVTSGEIAQTASRLVSGAEDEWSRLQALGRHAQNVNYVSIQTGIRRGGGYRPRNASEVLSKNYGDCKDKTNLLRSLLKSADIESYAVAIYAGDPDYVREEWPSPQQFNHAISAIRVSPSIEAPAVTEHAGLGRLLFFDPTDPVTPLGLLPETLQGAPGLVLAGDQGVLMELPAAPAEENILRRRIEARLGPDGSLSASLTEESTGNVGVREQRLFSRLSEPDYRQSIRQWIGEDVTRRPLGSPAGRTAARRQKRTIHFKGRVPGQFLRPGDAVAHHALSTHLGEPP